MKQIGTGVQHVVVLTTAEQDPSSMLPPLDQASLKAKFEMPKEEEPQKDEEKPVEEEVKGEKTTAKNEVTVPAIPAEKKDEEQEVAVAA